MLLKKVWRQVCATDKKTVESVGNRRASQQDFGEDCPSAGEEYSTLRQCFAPTVGILSNSDWLDNSDESHGKRARCCGSPKE